MKIEGFELFIFILEIILKKDNEKVINRKNEKNISIKLFIIIVIKVYKKSLLISYKFIKDKIVYNKTWDKIAKLFIIKKINKSIIKTIKINEDKIKNNEIKKS